MKNTSGIKSLKGDNKDADTGGVHHHQAELSSAAVTDNRPEAAALQDAKEIAVTGARMTAQRQTIGEAMGGTDHTVPNDTGMPDELQSGLEEISGFDLSDVQVHYNSTEPSRVGALAYAKGNEIHVAPGQEKHLPHEGWHIVQQRQGRVKPTTGINGNPVNDDPGLEREADTMGQKAAMKSTQQNESRKDRAHHAKHFMQRMEEPTQFVLTRPRRDVLADVTSIEELVPYLKGQFDNSQAIVKGDAMLRLLGNLARQWAKSQNLDLDDTELEALTALAGISNFQPSAQGQEVIEDVSEEFLGQMWHSNDTDAAELAPGFGYDPAECLEDELRNQLFPPQQQAAVAMQKKSIMQLRRLPNKVSGPKSYTSSKQGALTNIAYKTDGDGNIDFNAPHTYPTGKPAFKANKAGTLVDLHKGVKKAGYMCMPSKNLVPIKGASRGQHFAVANRIMGYNAGHSSPDYYTWHHLTDFGEMILVDRMVHSKHGHNGGMLLW